MMVDATTPGLTNDFPPSFAFEQVAAKLEPFDLLRLGLADNAGNAVREAIQRGRSGSLTNLDQISAAIRSPGSRSSQIRSAHALSPIFLTQGLVFPYNPSISESLNVKYDAVELTHTNESFHVYRGTDNVRINISDATWTCDTFDKAVYALSVIHFFRTYSQMDFGRGRTGRPPAPMWFSAYGNYAYHRVPVLMEKVDWNFPPDVDYVGIPEFGTTDYASQTLAYDRKSTSQYTWIPMVFKVSSISLVVQHSPKFWTNYNLESYRSGEMLRNRKSFHVTNPTEKLRK